MIYIVSIAVFTAVIFLLIGLILLVEAKVVRSEDCFVTINDDTEKPLKVAAGGTLLSALSENQILLPSACGGGGTCGTCKCRVDRGGAGILPTELAHLSRREKKENVRLACQLKVKEDLSIQIPREILDVQKYEATVLSNENVATFIKELVIRLENDADLDFQAGAFIQIDVPEYELSYSEFKARVEDRYRPEWDAFDLWGLQSKNETPIFRAYSLANPPLEKNVLRFTIRIATPPPWIPGAPPGVGSSFIFNLEPGDKIIISGPYGDFFAKKSEREMCFIGGGAGMAPLKSHILHQLEDVKSRRRISFWYGARSLQELFFSEQFEQLETAHANFSFHVALSEPKPEDGWSGMTGFIHDSLYTHYLSEHDDPTEIEYYLCGPPPMIDAVISMLDHIGVEAEMIAYDKF